MVNNQNYKIKDYDLSYCEVKLKDKTFSGNINTSLYNPIAIDNKSPFITPISTGLQVKQDCLAIVNLSLHSNLTSGYFGFTIDGLGNLYTQKINSGQQYYNFTDLVVIKAGNKCYPIVSVTGGTSVNDLVFRMVVIKAL